MKLSNCFSKSLASRIVVFIAIICGHFSSSVLGIERKIFCIDKDKNNVNVAASIFVHAYRESPIQLRFDLQEEISLRGRAEKVLVSYYRYGTLGDAVSFNSVFDREYESIKKWAGDGSELKKQFFFVNRCRPTLSSSLWPISIIICNASYKRQGLTVTN